MSPMFQEFRKWRKELTENGNFFKRKTETANLFLISANGNGRLFFLGRQTINSNRQLLFQQMCPLCVYLYSQEVNVQFIPSCEEEVGRIHYQVPVGQTISAVPNMSSTHIFYTEPYSPLPAP